MLPPKLKPIGYDTWEKETWETYSSRLAIPEDDAVRQFYRQVGYDHFDHFNDHILNSKLSTIITAQSTSSLSHRLLLVQTSLCDAAQFSLSREDNLRCCLRRETRPGPQFADLRIESAICQNPVKTCAGGTPIISYERPCH